MRKLLIAFFLSNIIPVYSCDQLAEIEKASHIINYTFRNIARAALSKENNLYKEVDHTVKVYYSVFNKSCITCQTIATMRYGEAVKILERFIASRVE